MGTSKGRVTRTGQPITGYEGAEEWLLDRDGFEGMGLREGGPDFKLERIHSVLRRLDNPECGRRTVHIAGSKGKGSTAAIIESVLRSAGYRTGLFTSPHLHKFTERIRINGAPLSDEEFVALCAAVRPIVDTEKGRVSPFEILTALAFHAFHLNHVNVQIVEVGLGGRLDSTNVFTKKDAAVITSLSYEHTGILGTEITQIASEKAGILNAGTRVAVLAPQPYADAADVIRAAASDIPIPVINVAEAYRWEAQGHESSGQWFRLTRTQPRPSEPLQSLYLLRLLGEHQLDNAMTAIATLDQLTADGMEIPSEALHRGLAEVSWPGRLEELPLPDNWKPPPGGEDDPPPRLVIDGAHNTESVERTLDACKKFFPYRRLLVIFGVTKDKKLESMADIIRERAWAVFATQASENPERARAAKEILEAFDAWDGVRGPFDDSKDALHKAMESARSGDLVLVIGSLFLAADLRKHTLPSPDFPKVALTQETSS